MLLLNSNVVKSVYTMTPKSPMYHKYKDRHIKKFKRVMRHMKLISMNRRLFWMHLKVHEVDQGAVHVHHDPTCTRTGTWRSSRGSYGTSK
jgi:hypothetical protein